VIQTSEAMQQAATAISELARLSEDLKEMIKELGG
jgi:methyl-accepting chemotaxis protein